MHFKQFCLILWQPFFYTGGARRGAAHPLSYFCSSLVVKIMYFQYLLNMMAKYKFKEVLPHCYNNKPWNKNRYTNDNSHLRCLLSFHECIRGNWREELNWVKGIVQHILKPSWGAEKKEGHYFLCEITVYNINLWYCHCYNTNLQFSSNRTYDRN